MSFFCPYCGNILLIDYPNATSTKWFCKSCPYVTQITGDSNTENTKKIYSKLQLKKKEVDEILGDEQWESAEVVSNIRCPRCHGKKAYFHMMQTRSSDEPMSQFFKCCNCSHFWRVD